jgi:hypothetical protein
MRSARSAQWTNADVVTATIDSDEDGRCEDGPSLSALVRSLETNAPEWLSARVQRAPISPATISESEPEPEAMLALVNVFRRLRAWDNELRCELAFGPADRG